MSLGKGIAIAGIWIGVTVACFAPAVTQDTVFFIFLCAVIATVKLQ